MKTFVTLTATILFGVISIPAFSQMPCEPEPPCYQPAENGVYCTTPATGCGYDYYNCDQPTLVARYAELAKKYHNLGPNERWNEIYNGNNEVRELQQIDNHYAQNGVPQGLTPEQELTLRTAQGSVLR